MEDAAANADASPIHPHDAALLAALRGVWGYDSFRPLQREAMRHALSARDAVVVLPTGGGKSLCFQAPAVAMGGMAVVVSPLIALMKDQVDSLRNCGVAAAQLNSSLTPEERRTTLDDIRGGRIKLLYVAPERLLTEGTMAMLQAANVSLAAVDEAHCISSWGHDFRPEYRGLARLKQAFPHIAVHAYTATASEQVRLDIAAQLGLDKPAMLVGSFDRPNLTYRVRRASKRTEQVVDFVRQHAGEAGIVYCISRREVDEVAERLKQQGLRAVPYHAGMDDRQRHRNQDAFLDERADVVVATVAFGMGIDKPNVRYVLHAGMPKGIEAYQQESGRAGRDGLEAECLLLYSPSDAMKWRQMVTNSGDSGVDGALASLAAIEGYCNSVVCRHRQLVQFFGQELAAENCGACDVCLGELETLPDPLVPAQKILSCVVRLEQRYGADYTAKVLTGSAESRILAAGHHQLSTYGLLKAEGQRAVRDWIEQLVGQGFARKRGDYDTLEVTPPGWRVLRGEVVPRLLRPHASHGPTPPKASASREKSWTGVDRGLFALLRERRNELAAEQGVPAYIVFGDDALRDMARRQPTTLEEFREVRGVGDKKLAVYGAEFTALIAQWQEG